MTATARNVVFVLLGVAALVLLGRYSGRFGEVAGSYGGNVSASFAAYFLMRIVTAEWRHRELWAGTLALTAASLFEATDGLGVLSNVYDPADFMANAVGVGVAAVIDRLAPAGIPPDAPAAR